VTSTSREDSREKGEDRRRERRTGEEKGGHVMLSETAAAYFSPEVAWEILVRARGESPPPHISSLLLGFHNMAVWRWYGQSRLPMV
jgi:hypothetical protein